MSKSSYESEDDNAPSDAVSDADEPSTDLSAFVREYITVDNDIRRLKAEVKPTTDRIRELSVKKRQLATVVATIMGDNDIDDLEPKIGGEAVGRLTRVYTKRVKPTAASFEKAVLDTLLGGDADRLRQIKQSALRLDKPAVATLRRSKKK